MIAQQKAIIEARSVGYDYPDEEERQIRAVESVDVNINRGDYLALIGPNGSGKTTLLKLFNALLTPSRGEVLVEGISTAEAGYIPQIRRSCGMIFQNPDNQLVATTVEEDIAFGLENMALPSAEIRQRVVAVAERLGLGNLLLHPPHLLSGGEKQRVAIAGVLAMHPKCILMDEPTAMLDPRGRNEVLGTVSQLNKEDGLTVIHVTHFPEEALLADRVIVMNNGIIVGDGPPSAIFTNLELLHQNRLRGPFAVELAEKLTSDGFLVPEDILENWELADYLCSLKRKN